MVKCTNLETALSRLPLQMTQLEHVVYSWHPRGLDLFVRAGRRHRALGRP